MKRFFVFISNMILIAGCSSSQNMGDDLPETGMALQLILVETGSVEATTGTLYMLEKKREEWQMLDSFAISVGRNGLADDPAGEMRSTGRYKKEGDGCSPAGIFPLLYVFGYADTMATKMPYIPMSAFDLCIDDVHSPEYNRHVYSKETLAVSHEKMKRKDHLYAMGIWVGYNSDPVVAGNGSCIFLHIWRDTESPTSGCTAMSASDLQKIITWLDADKHPALVQRVKR